MVLNKVEKNISGSWMSLKGGYQFYHDARTFLRLHRTEALNDVMKVTGLETLFICVNKNFKKGRCKIHTHTSWGPSGINFYFF